MKYSTIPIILFAACLTISGQQLNQQTNHYRSGDMLEKKQVAVKDFSITGSEKVIKRTESWGRIL